MKLENLAPAKGATKARKRIGRGEGSGQRQDGISVVFRQDKGDV